MRMGGGRLCLLSKSTMHATCLISRCGWAKRRGLVSNHKKKHCTWQQSVALGWSIRVVGRGVERSFRLPLTHYTTLYNCSGV